MRKEDDDSGIPEEDTVIHNLPLYTERRADGIFWYRRRVPKALVGHVGKGYLYRNLGRRKEDGARAWPEADADVERIIALAQEGVYPPTLLWTSQHRPRASAIRPTTGLGSGCIWSVRGWGRAWHINETTPSGLLL